MAAKQIKYKGLSQKQVKQKRLEFGSNVLTPVPKPSLWRLYWEKFEDPVIRILLIVAVVSLVIAFFENDYMETIGIIAAIFLATAIGFYFEYDASKKFDVLNQVNDESSVTVIREGEIHTVPRSQLVPEDIVMIETGDEIPADGILLESLSLQVNESNLTGELQTNKTIDASFFDEEATYASNLLLKGTTVLTGHGVMKVTEIGDATEIGKVAHESSEILNQETPLKIQLGRLAKYIGWVGFSVSGLVFVLLYVRNVLFSTEVHIGPKIVSLSFLFFLFIATLHLWLPKEKLRKYYLGSSIRCVLFGFFLAGVFLLGSFYYYDLSLFNEWEQVKGYMFVLESLIDYFLLAVALIVVCVPEGLPMSVTLSLALSMRRMLTANNLVRKMHASETMGAITVICSDKTGTLTRNQMEVHRLFVYQQELNEKIELSEEKRALVEENIALNSTAFLEKEEKSFKMIGNPTESALLIWLNKRNTDYMKFRNEIKIVAQLPFSTERKLMATLIYSPILKKHILYVKGASDILFELSQGVLGREGVEILALHGGEMQHQLLTYQEKGMRTLGFAYTEVEDVNLSIDAILAQKKLLFYGFVALEDPIRSEVPKAVRSCSEAGIRVKIVTGDTSATAIQIAKEIGIWEKGDNEKNHLTGADFASMSDEQLELRLSGLKVISRAKPTDKQRLVNLLQKTGEVVAVTGDGTNDAPALNHAQVGLSMGSGTSVAKEASDITIIDDSFASITKAVMWGRSLYKNIQRFIVFQLTINVVAMFVMLFGSFFQEVVVLTVTQMLWVNLIMDTLAALALASLPPNPSVMKDSPRNKNTFIITRAMFRQIIFYAVFFVLLMGVFVQYGISLNISQMDLLNLFFTFFVLLQFWNLLNVSVMDTQQSAFSHLRKEKGLVFVLFLILLGQILIVQFGSAVFRTQPLTLNTWLLLLFLSSIALWVGEIVRFYQRKKNKK